MTEISVNDCQREVDCTYDDERYSVRNNGAIMRPNDNKFIFARPRHHYLFPRGGRFDESSAYQPQRYLQRRLFFVYRSNNECL